MQNDKNQDGVLTWVLIGACCLGVMGAMVWLVASHLIIYHFTPIVHAIAFPWRLVPQSLTGSTVPDLDFDYLLFRRHPAYIGFADWMHYVNLAFRPWTVLFAVFALWRFRVQHEAVKSRRVTEQMTPGRLAEVMMDVFTDIAPVVKIQEKLVANKLKRWRRQTSPDEFLRNAKYQGRSLLIPNVETGQLQLDPDRLRSYLTQCGEYKHAGKTLLRSPFLGRQLIDVVQDKDQKELAFLDRLSPAGKAIYAILAPYAFDGSKGKKESAAVSDALNLSAYGSNSGMANLSLDAVAEAFEKWKRNGLARKLVKMHNWEYTFLHALLEHAQRSGKIGTWKFIWLKPTDRIMFYALNLVGRKAPHTESALAHSQFKFERKTAKMGRLPLDKNHKPVIFHSKVVDSLIEEWKAWLEGDDDNENWWMNIDEPGSALISALGDLNAPPPVPGNAI